MGWEAWKITYSSDYFEELYQFAVQLIKTGNAYVCHQVTCEWADCVGSSMCRVLARARVCVYMRVCMHERTSGNVACM